MKKLKRLQIKRRKNSEAPTGFERMTSAIPVRCSTDWATKPRRKQGINWTRTWPASGEMRSNRVGASEFFLGFCNCLSYFTTAEISLTSITTDWWLHFTALTLAGGQMLTSVHPSSSCKFQGQCGAVCCWAVHCSYRFLFWGLVLPQNPRTRIRIGIIHRRKENAKT